MTLRALLARHDIPQSRLAEVLGVADSTVSQKMSGSRRWTLEESLRLTQWFLDEYGEALDLHDLAQVRQ